MMQNIQELNVSLFKTISVNLLKALEMSNHIVTGLYAIDPFSEWDV